MDNAVSTRPILDLSYLGVNKNLINY